MAVISMYFFDKRQQHKPHIHVRYQGEEIVLAIREGEILEGTLKANKLKLAQAWIEIHREELMADWELASLGELVFKIDHLK